MSELKLGMGVSPGTVYVGKLNKEGTEWLQGKEDITKSFINVMHQYIKDGEAMTITHQDGKEHVFIHCKNDIDSINKTIMYLQKKIIDKG